VLALLLASGWRTAGAQAPAAFSAQEQPFATISRMLLRTPQRDSLVDLARAQVGLRYRLGAKAPGRAFDCSGLVQWIMSKFDMVLPRTSREQVKVGVAIPKDSAALLPGDLLFFGRGTRITHVGIYVGDGKYVQAANRRVGVVESRLPTGRAAVTWWKTVRRLFVNDTATGPPADSTATTPGVASSS
jgi:cell wall-associated NlpC family hydrolase